MYKELNVKNFGFIYYFSVLIKLYEHKHLIPMFDNEHTTIY